MAHLQKLPNGALGAIAKQVGRLYPSLDKNVTQHQPAAELRETFRVWFLPVDEIVIGKNNLLEIAQDTNRWHSQIWIDGKPKGVVRFTPPSEDAPNWTVTQVLKGDLAEKVEDTIDWIDREIKADPLVHILEIPSLFTTAFWLINEKESSVVIAKCPEYLHSLSPLEEYSAQDFLQRLRQEPYTVGIHNEQSQPPHQGKRSTSERETFNVLSIDTGTDGIIPAMILAEIEDRTGLPTADNFDLIAGTSAGGSLALGLSATGDKGKPQYKASELVEIYSEGLISSTEIHLTEVEKLSRIYQNVLGVYFPKGTLGNVLEQTKTMVAYYNTETNTPFFLKSWEPEHTAVEMLHPASIASAVFTHFNPSPLPIGTKTGKLVDGGVFIKPPVVSAYEEAKKIIAEEENFEHLEDSNIFVLWIGDATTINNCQNLPFLKNNGFRLYPSPDEVGPYMDNLSIDNITNLRGLADKLIKSAKFQEVCDRLMAAI